MKKLYVSFFMIFKHSKIVSTISGFKFKKKVILFTVWCFFVAQREKNISVNFVIFILFF